MNHAYACGGFPTMDLQRSDPRWHQLAEYVFLLNEMDDLVRFVPNDAWRLYAEPDLCAIFKFDKDSVTRQMDAGRSTVILDLSVTVGPDWRYDDAIRRFSDLCERLQLNFDAQILRLPVSLEPQLFKNEFYIKI